MLLDWHKMNLATFETIMELVITIITRVYLILIQNTFIFVSHNAKKFIIHSSFLKTCHELFLLHKINDSIVQGFNIILVEFSFNKIQ